MAIRLSEIQSAGGGGSISNTDVEQNTQSIALLESEMDAMQLDMKITPNPSISLEADSVPDAVTELATDIHEMNDIESLSLNYNLLRNAT